MSRETERRRKPLAWSDRREASGTRRLCREASVAAVRSDRRSVPLREARTQRFLRRSQCPSPERGSSERLDITQAQEQPALHPARGPVCRGRSPPTRSSAWLLGPPVPARRTGGLHPAGLAALPRAVPSLSTHVTNSFLLPALSPPRSPARHKLGQPCHSGWMSM